ncbi:MAG TPA: hypothetical protein VME47_18070 [Acetobacteraceae bacterium]|nr:hypothetical protein [Acetobacteraceae bacterium]
MFRAQARICVAFSAAGHDGIDRGSGGAGRIELLENADELARAVAVFDAGTHLSGEQLDPTVDGNRSYREVCWSPPLGQLFAGRHRQEEIIQPQMHADGRR